MKREKADANDSSYSNLLSYLLMKLLSQIYKWFLIPTGVTDKLILPGKK